MTHAFRPIRRRYAISAFVALFALAQTSFLLADGKAPTPTKVTTPVETGRVYSDTSGRITEILVHYDDQMNLEMGPFYQDLFSALGPGVRIRVLTTSNDAAQEFAEIYKERATANGRIVEVINVGMCLSLWARDRCIPRRSDTPGAMAPTFVPIVNPYYEFEKQNDLRTQRMMFRALLGPTVLRSWLHLEGGNVIANDRMVFIGSNVLDENDCDDDDPQMPRELDRVTGRPWTLMGEGLDSLPWDHVDMYMTPIGNNTMLVGDATMGQQILAHQGEENLLYPCVDVQGKLDNIANQIKKMGYMVQRIPIVFDPAGDWIITYNNVLMEEREGRKVAFVPVYDIDVLDKAGADVYRHLGFEVHQVNVAGIYQYGGAVRCLTNVTKREQNEKNTKLVSKIAGHGGLRIYDLSSYQNRKTKTQRASAHPKPEDATASPQRQ